MVKMTFSPEKLDIFMEIFSQSAPLIRNFQGCTGLELLQHSKFKNILYTYSWWESESELEVYRNSELFESTWKATKVLFSAPAEAWSMISVDQIQEDN
jgi:heme-degrading monooxygenase HmoA